MISKPRYIRNDGIWTDSSKEWQRWLSKSPVSPLCIRNHENRIKATANRLRMRRRKRVRRRTITVSDKSVRGSNEREVRPAARC